MERSAMIVASEKSRQTGIKMQRGLSDSRFTI